MLILLSIIVVVVLSIPLFNTIWLWHTQSRVARRLAFAASICEAANLNAVGVCRYIADVAELVHLSERCVNTWRWELPKLLEEKPEDAGIGLAFEFSATEDAIRLVLRQEANHVEWTEDWQRLRRRAMSNRPVVKKEVA